MLQEVGTVSANTLREEQDWWGQRGGGGRGFLPPSCVLVEPLVGQVKERGTLAVVPMTVHLVVV